MNTIHVANMIQFPSRQPSERRRRRRRARRNEIVDTAMLLVQEHGIESLTLHAVAERLDLAVGTLYRYVRNKNELISALQREVLDVLDANTGRCRQRCAVALRDPEADPEQRRIRALLPIVAIGELYRRFSQEAPALFSLLAVSVGDPRQLLPDRQAAQAIATARPQLAALAADLDAAAATGALHSGPAAVRAMAFWGALHGVLQLRKMTRFAGDMFPVDAIAGEVTATLLRGWGADGQLVDAAAEAVRADDLAGFEDVRRHRT